MARRPETSCDPSTVLSCVLSFSCRYIRSERSVILINFCLSIISSNALILIGQTQTRNKVRNRPEGGVTSRCLSRPDLIHEASLCPPSLSLSALTGLMHPDCGVSSLLLPVLVLLGSDGGVAVVHGRHGPPQESHNPQALPVSRLGWAFKSAVSRVFRPSPSPLPRSRLVCSFSQVSLHWSWRSQSDSPRRKAMEHQASKHVFH